MNIPELVKHLAAQGIELWFEGDRLRFRGPAGALTQEERAILGGRRSEVISVLRQQAASDTRVAPLSYGQRSLWFTNQDQPTSSAYNIAFAASVNSPINRDALRHAMQALVDRHAILRTTYHLAEGSPVQRVAGTASAVVDFHDAPGVSSADLQRLVQADYQRPFDLASGPVVRTTVFSRGTDDVLLIVAHHVALDGWSLLMLLNEFRELYLEQTGGPAAALARPDLEYTDYTDWQAKLLASVGGEQLVRYWETKLAAPRAEVEVPLDHPRPPRKAGRGASLDFRLDPELSGPLTRLARSEGTTLFVLFLAAYKALLYRYTGTQDLVVGTPTLGRNNGQFNRVFGHFVNAVPLRSAVSADLRFTDLVKSIRQTLVEALEAQEYPLAMMVERLHPVRDPSRSPFFETMFVFQRFEQFREIGELLVHKEGGNSVDFGGLRVKPFPLRQQEGQFDFGLGLTEGDEGFTGSLRYNPEIYDDATARRFVGHYQQLLRSVVATPGEPIARLGLLSLAERADLLAKGGSPVPPAPGVPLHRRFEAQAAQTPDAMAVSHGEEALTYDQLNRRANQLAHRLSELGVLPNTVVGLYAERSVGLVAGLIGILKAGGAYLPIDQSYPAERVAFILKDAGAVALVTEGARVGDLPGYSGPIVMLDDEGLAVYPSVDPDAGVKVDDLMYVIYTSGSTGKPKGTLLTHRAVDRLLQSTEPWFGFGPADVWTLFHSVAFDFSVWELWGALRYGGRLVVVPFWISRSPEAFLDLLHREKVTVLNQTPSAFRQLIQAETTTPARDLELRYVVFGGEALELQSLRPWFERHGDVSPQLVNMYGITETCVHVTYRPIRRVDLDAGRGSVIGVPIPDLTIHVLDPFLEPVPIGVAGELYVGGPGLALGYLDRPELTAERFIDDPFRPGQRLYRTGDLARRLADGDLEYLGRADDQIKIRGFRIELGEIEAVLGVQPGVVAGVVAVSRDALGGGLLVAYVVPAANGGLDQAALRAGMRAQLPEYMVPSAFVSLDSLPLTRNGKLDRAALTKAAQRPQVDPNAFEAPTTALEEQVAACWCSVLGLPRVSVRESFFDLGGHSLLATSVLAHLRRLLRVDLPLRAIFENPTVRDLAAHIEAASKSASGPSPARAGRGQFEV